MPRTSKQVERTDAMILRRFPRGSHATQEGLTKLNKQLDKVTLPTFACLTALHTYRKNMWARQSDRGQNDEVTAADLRRWSGMRDVWQAGTSLLCSYIIARAGQVVKGFDVNRFLALKQLQPLQLATMPPSRDRDRQFVQSEHGKHLGKFVTMRTLLRISQLHPVEVMEQRWLQEVPNKDRGTATVLQGLLRNQELRHWWEIYAKGGFQRETFRLTYDTPTSYSNEGTTELNALPSNPYARNSRLLEGFECDAFRKVDAMLAHAPRVPVLAAELEATLLQIPGIGPFVATGVLEAAAGAGLVQGYKGTTICLGTNTKAFLQVISPGVPVAHGLTMLSSQIKQHCSRGNAEFKEMICPRLVQRSCCKLWQLLKTLKSGQLKNCRRIRSGIAPWVFGIERPSPNC